MTASLAAARNADLPRTSEQALRFAYELSSRLMDSLVHDVRNPLNALAINIEVLSEKTKSAPAGMSEGLKKNFSAMKEQVQKVDALLRRFSEFVATPLFRPGEVDFSEMVGRALDVLGYEARKRRVRFHPSFEPGIRVQSAHLGELRQAVLQILFWSMEKTPPNQQVVLSTRRANEEVVLEVLLPASEIAPDETQALLTLCKEYGLELSTETGRLELSVDLN